MSTKQWMAQFTMHLFSVKTNDFGDSVLNCNACGCVVSHTNEEPSKSIFESQETWT